VRNAADLSAQVPRASSAGRSGDFTVVQSDSTLFKDMGEVVKVEDISDGDILHCPTCDVMQRSEGDIPDLRPCMRAFAPNRFELMLYCFGCNTLSLIRNIVDYTGFKEDAVLLPADSGYITAEHVLGDIATDDILRECDSTTQQASANGRWLLAVNSPIGSGKTEAVADITRRKLADGPFLVITYRRALARQLAERFNATCYLDVSENDMSMNCEKLVICTNNLHRLATGTLAQKYALIIIDEEAFGRRHYVQGTFRKSEDRFSSFSVLEQKVLQARMVIIMQDALSNSDVTFYRAMGCFDTDRVRRIYMPRKPLSDTIESTIEEGVWLTALKKCVSSGNKVLVCCSVRKDAEVLYKSILENELFRPEKYSPEEWGQRVALMKGTDAFTKSKLQDADEFALSYKELDVAVATSVLETGVSLSGHYTHVFGNFKRTPMTHSTQAQLDSCVRNAQLVFLLL
jgi:hypothetical protein